MRKYADDAAIDCAVAGNDAIAGRAKPVLNEEIEFIEATRVQQQIDSFPGSEFSLSMHFGYFFFTAPKSCFRFDFTEFCNDISHVRDRLGLHVLDPSGMTCGAASQENDLLISPCLPVPYCLVASAMVLTFSIFASSSGQLIP
jgi:hypothetical protein